jgi:small nuclear ribonucleoprotein (snRNP)-like protein
MIEQENRPLLRATSTTRTAASRCGAFIAVLLIAATAGFAQRDSLVLKNGDVIVGELKSLDAGVATIETDYSKKDFTIEWDGVKKVYSRRRYLVTMRDGERFNGSVRSADDDGVVLVDELGPDTLATTLMDVVLLKGLETDFWSRLRANVDVGLTVTKANNLRQYSSQSSIGYLVDQWELTLSYDANQSSQDSVEDIKRTEASAEYIYFLPADWFLQSVAKTLSNTEQALDMRFQATVSGGQYLVHTNRSYFRVGAGLSFNDESYTNETPDKSSLEASLGAELDLFDIGDLNFHSTLFAYPSLTEPKRLRSDFNLDVKYDILDDFYIKFNTTVYYDNKPAVAGAETDYTYGISVGWEME